MEEENLQQLENSHLKGSCCQRCCLGCAVFLHLYCINYFCFNAVVIVVVILLLTLCGHLPRECRVNEERIRLVDDFL